MEEQEVKDLLEHVYTLKPEEDEVTVFVMESGTPMESIEEFQDYLKQHEDEHQMGSTLIVAGLEDIKAVKKAALKEEMTEEEYQERVEE